MNRLGGKVALVTGSSRGIGAAIAKLFAHEGARLALHGRDGTALSGVRAAIQNKGGEAEYFTADVTHFDEIEAVRVDIERRLGPVDILVANAGGNVVPPAPLEQISEAGWRAVLDDNLTATFLTIKSFLPRMRERKRGVIITLSSAAARRADPRSPIPYAAAKAGIHILTQHLAAQAGPDGVRVNCIAPETVLTERNSDRIPHNLQIEMAGCHPVRRLGTPEDVAEAALFLATESASWITGSILDVAGGAVMR